MKPFHLAFAVRDLDETRQFYANILGCSMGRYTETWQDFDLFGHQLSAHLGERAGEGGGAVDGKTVPIPHFGVILPMQEWRELADRLRAAKIEFLLGPEIRFQGEPGEQATFFIRDPSGNGLEFKGMANLDGVFATGKQ